MHVSQVIVPTYMVDENLLPVSHITGDPCFDAVIDQCRKVICVGKIHQAGTLPYLRKGR